MSLLRVVVCWCLLGVAARLLLLCCVCVCWLCLLMLFLLFVVVAIAGDCVRVVVGVCVCC